MSIICLFACIYLGLTQLSNSYIDYMSSIADNLFLDLISHEWTVDIVYRPSIRMLELRKSYGEDVVIVFC